MRASRVPILVNMEYRFSGVRYLRTFTAGFFGFCTVIFVVQAFNPGNGGAGLTVLASASAVVSAVLTVRGARCATIIARDTGAEYRALARTRRWTWPQVETFEARDSREGMMQYRRRVLFVQERQGQVRKLQEINAAASRRPNPIDEIADRLNGLARPTSQ
jgi:hypothetical protein